MIAERTNQVGLKIADVTVPKRCQLDEKLEIVLDPREEKPGKIRIST